MIITAAMVKDLRERTGEPMMDCKKALVEAEGDIEKAIEIMRMAGQAKAVKRAGKIAAQGIVVVLSTPAGQRGVLVEVNCETDFVARQEQFIQFAQKVAKQALQHGVAQVEQLSSLPLDSNHQTIEEARQGLVAQLGENITIRRVALHEAPQGIVGVYAHGDANGVRIGSLVCLEGGSLELARELAMHVAAMNPEYTLATEIPVERIERDRVIFRTELKIREPNKPDTLIEKMVDGKLKKMGSELALVEQAFIRDPSQTVGDLLRKAGAKVHSFARFAVGEGIEKETSDFAEEVMAQVRGN